MANSAAPRYSLFLRLHWWKSWALDFSVLSQVDFQVEKALSRQGSRLTRSQYWNTMS